MNSVFWVGVTEVDATGVEGVTEVDVESVDSAVTEVVAGVGTVELKLHGHTVLFALVSPTLQHSNNDKD